MTSIDYIAFALDVPGWVGDSKPQPKTKPLHHRGTESRRKQKINGFLFGPPIRGCIQGLDIPAFSRQQKNEDTEVLNLPAFRHSIRLYVFCLSPCLRAEAFDL